MKPKKAPKGRLKRKIMIAWRKVAPGKLASERRAWVKLRNSAKFLEWRQKELPTRAAVAFFVNPPEPKLTPGEAAKEILTRLDKKKSKSTLEKAQSHYLRQVLKSPAAVSDFERWVKRQKSYGIKFNILLENEGGQAMAAEAGRKELMLKDIPQALKRFRSSREGAGKSSFSRILEGYLKSLENIAEGGDRPIDDYWRAHRSIIQEALVNAETRKKLKKEFDELLK